MARARTGLAAVVALVAIAACSDGRGEVAGRDAAAVADAAIFDAGVADSGSLDAGPLDAGMADVSVVDAGADPVGVITGSCGELDDTELLGGGPFFFRNTIDFADPYTSADEARLTAGAQEILSDGTAGGSSGLSEAFAFEVLARCEGAILVKTETEIVYEPADSKKTDILVTIDGHRIGVSVTRAVGFPREDPYTVMTAQMLLEDKLADILVSSANVVAEDAWVKQILHVIAYEPMHGDSMMTAWAAIDPALRADTILWVTVTDGDDGFIY